ncbi:hypothetical protein ILUMI_15123, partial [Ignelater luminosus]
YQDKPNNTVQRCFKCNRPGHIQRYCRSNTHWRGGYSRNPSRNNLTRVAGNPIVEDGAKAEGTSNSFNVEVMSAETNRKQEAYTVAENDIKWLLDSGCSDHIVNTDRYFSEYINLTKPVHIKVGDGFSLKSNKIGNIDVYFNVSNKLIKTKIKNVYYVPSMSQNSLSVSCIVNQNNSVIFKNDSTKIYNCEDELTAVVTKLNKLFKLDGKVRGSEITSYASSAEISKKEKLAKAEGIYLRTGPPHNHELNGVAERVIGHTAAYIGNRLLANTKIRKTPYEIFFNKKPDVSNLHLYGSTAFVRISKESRFSKLDSKAVKGILVGYTDTGYRILINNKIIISRHVQFIEKHTKYIRIEGNECTEDTNEHVQDDETGQKQEIPSETEINEKDNEIEEGTNSRRSRREIKLPRRFDDHVVYVNYSNASVPESYKEAVNCPNSKNFDTLMEVNLKLEPVDNVNQNLKYRNRIGALLDIMDAYVDADWAADIIDRKSTTGVLIRVYGNAVLWKSQKQKIVSRASTHAKYYALADCVEKVIPIKGILTDLGVMVNPPIKIYEDNTGAIALAKKGKFSKNSKHID